MKVKDEGWDRRELYTARATIQKDSSRAEDKALTRHSSDPSGGGIVPADGEIEIEMKVSCRTTHLGKAERS